MFRRWCRGQACICAHGQTTYTAVDAHSAAGALGGRSMNCSRVHARFVCACTLSACPARGHLPCTCWSQYWPSDGRRDQRRRRAPPHTCAQVLVFVHSRKETAKTARFAKDSALKEDKLARFVKADRCVLGMGLTTVAHACADWWRWSVHVFVLVRAHVCARGRDHWQLYVCHAVSKHVVIYLALCRFFLLIPALASMVAIGCGLQAPRFAGRTAANDASCLAQCFWCWRTQQVPPSSHQRHICVLGPNFLGLVGKATP